MQSVPVYQAKNQLSELIATAESGEEVTIIRRRVTRSQPIPVKN